MVAGASGTPRNPAVPQSTHPAGLQLLHSASRGFSVGISSTYSPKACQVVAENAEIDIFVVDTDRQLRKIIQVSEALACGNQEAHGWGTVQAKARASPSEEGLERQLHG